MRPASDWTHARIERQLDARLLYYARIASGEVNRSEFSFLALLIPVPRWSGGTVDVPVGGE